MQAPKIVAIVTVIPKENDVIPLGDRFFLDFVGTELDPKGNEQSFRCEVIITGAKEKKKEKKIYAGDIQIPQGFGDIGAVIVELVKEASNEKFIQSVKVRNLSLSERTLFKFRCNSWVQPKNLLPNHSRIFFSTKSYLPEKTPAGLVKLRAEDLANLRGEGPDGKEDTTERAKCDRIYNYDVYNDLGDPDENKKWKRPVLGGSEQYPYPRRCRTGRSPCAKDKDSEERTIEKFYVPRDEEFSEAKIKATGISHPKMKAKEMLAAEPFSDFNKIDTMFQDGIEIPPDSHKIFTADIFFNIDPKKSVIDKDPLPLPEALKRDKFYWLSDVEFARQTLAGVNPYSIQLVKSWPLKSKLDPQEYGPQDSALTTELIQKLIGSSITVIKAVVQKKLFVLDYHDTFMPYVTKVRSINETTLYGSRTLFFLNPDDTLRPLAIELARPPMNGMPHWNKVFSPSDNATDAWLWRFAKAHVLAHDSCVQQVVVHWLRSHCSMEPYVIATNRQLSTMHPIYRLLHPHFRYTMRINANARERLMNAGGIVEATFSTATYSMEFSSLMYKKEWQFDTQALPEDLIHRGMAERDEKAPHRLKLAIKDYPFANDGLILWDALNEWIEKYVGYYYPNKEAIANDNEVTAWWNEIKEKGHADKSKEAGWPSLETPNDLIKIVTSIAWLGCGHHSAVNFLQYENGVYFPGRPSIVRTKMPIENREHVTKEFMDRPEADLLQAFPTMHQAYFTGKMLQVLSTHSSDEEYIGSRVEAAWDEEPHIVEAFKNFQDKLKTMDTTIDQRNENTKLKNRRGAGVVPYQVFKHTSEPGLTGKGLPYSAST